MEKEDLIALLRENLKIKICTDMDYGLLEIEVELKFDEETISKSKDSIRLEASRYEYD